MNVSVASSAIREEDLITLTSELVAAAGENPGGTEAATVAVLERACRAEGFDVTVTEVAQGRSNLVATLNVEGGDACPGLLFLGHSDVVPAGPGWTRDPFAPVVEGGRLYGRGATDMKGGLACVVVAMAAVAASSVPLSGPVTLACTVDEEDLGLGIRSLVADPARAGLAERYGGCIVAEPTDLELVVGCRGASYLEIDVTGIPAHSGRPSDGRNAIDAASRIIELIRRDHEHLAHEGDFLLGPATWNVGRIAGGRGTSMVAPDARLWVDRRLLPGEDPHRIAAALLRRVDEAGITGDGISVEVAVTMEMPGFRTPDTDPFVTAVQVAGRDVGLEVPGRGWSAACDGGFVSRDLGVPTVVAGPGGLNDQAHQVDESVGVSELLRAARWYATVVEQMLGPGAAPT